MVMMDTVTTTVTVIVIVTLMLCCSYCTSSLDSSCTYRNICSCREEDKVPGRKSREINKIMMSKRMTESEIDCDGYGLLCFKEYGIE